MNTQKNTYHHGNLKIKLVEVAIRIIREGGMTALSMRRLAEEAGVSRSASYHHFKDKHSLLCAIAESGFHTQDQLLRELPADDMVERFSMFVLNYIHFASEHSEQYDLMYGREIWHKGNVTESLMLAANNSFKLWLTEVEFLQKSGVMDASISTLRLAQVTWATLHGLSRLFIDKIYIDNNDIDEMGRAAVQLLLNKNS